MAEFSMVMPHLNRMCDLYGEDCRDCPLHRSNNRENMVCKRLLREKPDKAETIILAWAEKNPYKSLFSVFFERNPKALSNEYGMPMCCPHVVGLADTTESMSICIDNIIESPEDCLRCWSRPYGE